MNKFLNTISKAINKLTYLLVHALGILGIISMFKGNSALGIAYFLSFAILRTLILVEDIKTELNQPRYIIIRDGSEANNEEVIDKDE